MSRAPHTAIDIDARLFSHILNDPFLLNSSLEGESFERTISYLNQYIATLAPGKLPNKVRYMQQACEDLASCQSQLNALNGLLEAGQKISEISKDFEKKINELTPENYLLIPGGWRTQSGGHAMIYELSKNERGDLLFSIYNSGAGLNFHEKKSSPQKELYNPVLTYKIPKNKVNLTFFQRFIEKLLSLQLSSLTKLEKVKVDEEYLYHRVFTQLAHVNGLIVNSSTPPHCYTAGQLSGTCAQRSLHQMIKARFTNVDDYRIFIYGLKKKACDDFLEKYLHDLKNYTDSLERGETITGPNPFSLYYQTVLEGVKHTLRLVLLQRDGEPTIDLFDHNTKKTDIKTLTEYLAELDKQNQKYTALTAQKQQKSEAILIELTQCSSSYQVTTLPEIKSPPSEPAALLREHSVLPQPLGGGDALLTNMDALINQCEALKNGNQNQAIREILEHFFLNLPLPGTLQEELLPFYSAIKDKEAAFLFYQKINALQEYYFNCCDQLISEEVTLPRMYLVKLSVISVVAHIDNNHRVVRTEPFYPALSEFTKKFELTEDTVYLAQHNKAMDSRLLAIRKIWRQQKTKSDRTDYYRRLSRSLSNDFSVLAEELRKNVDEEFYSYGDRRRQDRDTIVYDGYWHLYFLIQYSKKSQKEEKFKPLLTQLALQEEMEKAYACRTMNRNKKGVWILNFRASDRISLEVTAEGNRVIVYSPSRYLSSDTMSPTRLDQYTLSNDSAAYHALDIDSRGLSKRADNQTQLVSSNQRAQKSTLEERELFHLRRNRDFQITLTLNYFSLHPEKLIKEELKIYLEANLFQPGLLIQQLEKNPDGFFCQFNTLIEKGMRFHEKNGEPGLHSITFIRLGYLVTQYAVDCDSIKFKVHFDNFLKQLNHLIEITSDENIKASLHQYRFLTTVTQLESYPLKTISPDELSNIITSFFYIQTNHNIFEKLDEDSQFQIECAKYRFISLLEKHKAQITETFIPSILKQYGFTDDTISTLTFSGGYPIGECRKKTNNELCYLINFENGTISLANGMTYQSTPQFISKHPLVARLQLQEAKNCFVSQDKTLFQIEQPPSVIRIIKCGKKYSIQKKWPDENGAWYQLAASSKAQQKFFDLSETHFFASSLPAIFSEYDTLTWVHENKHEILITNQKNQIAYRGSLVGNSLQLTDAHNARLVSNDSVNDILSNIEDQNYIIQNQTTAGSKINILLPRYDLVFSAEKDPKTNHTTLSFKKDDVVYQVTQPNNYLGKHIAHLSLKHEQQEICILPIQRFISADPDESKLTGIYRLLKQDLNNTIPQITLSHKLRLPQNEQLWQHHQTEHVLILKVKKGKPFPQTSAEALYLCYVYLGSNQPEKAWEVLEDCQKRLRGLSGTEEELRYLEWICKALPYLRPNETGIEISTPAFVACKLKALSLFSQFAMQDKKIALAQPIVASANNSEQYKNIQLEETQLFNSRINQEIKSLYLRMQNMRRDTTIELFLSDIERKSLLDYYHYSSNTENAPKGAMGHEWTVLRLAILAKEKKQLVSLSSHIKTPFEKRREEEIERQLRAHQGVTSHSSQIAEVDVDLTFQMDKVHMPSDASTFRLVRNDFEKRYDYMHCAVANLHPFMSEQDFMRIFPALCVTILKPRHEKTDWADPDCSRQCTLQQIIKEYCIATLKAYSQIPYDKHDTAIPLLCNVLYRLACNQATIRDPNFQNLPELINYATKQLKALPAIKTTHLVDREIRLTSASEILEKIPRQPVKEKPVISNEKINKIRSLTLFDTKKSLELWAKWDKQLQTGIEDKTQPIPDERASGKIKYHALGELKKLAMQELGDDTVRATLATEIQSRINEIRAIRYDLESEDDLESELLKLGNLGPSDEKAKIKWDASIAVGKHHRLDINRLITLYLHNDQQRYADETGLSPKNINRLHSMIAQYIAQQLILQQLDRISSELKNVIEAKSLAEREQSIFQLAKKLYAENLVDTVTEPALSVFQYYEKKLLHPQQKEAIERLLSSKDGKYDEIVEKVIMGGGKSKILLPLLALQKATGSNLAIIVVPDSLLYTNYRDLSMSSQLFNQSPIIFEFDRDRDCSPAKLAQLYAMLKEDVMDGKHYLLTTGKALRSLRSTYLEFLKTKPTHAEKINSWEEQVKGLEKLVLLFKKQGDAIVDEAHQEFSLKNKLNYTLGESGRIPPVAIQKTVELYAFFKKVSLSEIPGLENKTLNDVLKNNKLITDDTQFVKIQEILATKLICDENSPLYLWVFNAKTKHLNADKQLIAYLQNKGGTKPPSCVLEALPEEKAIIALYKEQVSHLLPYTLKRNQGEHYGESHDESHPIAQRVLAIPYSANNIPNESSRFGNYLESINCSIQSLLISGIPKELLKEYLANLQTQAEHQHLEKNIRVDDTPAAKIFNLLTKNQFGTLSSVNLENDVQLTQLHTALYQQDDLIYEILKTMVLKNIKTDPKIISSNAYDQVRMLRSCQAVTGTPSNHPLYHKRITHDKKTALGTDGYILTAIEAKKPTIHGIDFKDSTSFIRDVFAPYDASSHVRTIIDVSATFKGISNIVIASEIAQFIFKNSAKFSQPEPVQYILYFNAEKQLAALRVCEHPENETPIVIGSSDNDIINERLNCKPGARFTYYDQSHTLGTDIAQSTEAKALVLIDPDVKISPFEQADLRMRELVEGVQSIDLVVPSILKENTIGQLIARMEDNEKKQLQTENFEAAQLGMYDLVCDNFMEHILSITGVNACERKHLLFKIVEKYFIEEQLYDLFALYGEVDQEKATAKVLEDLQKKLIQDWEVLINTSPHLFEAIDLGVVKDALNTEMSKIVHWACQPDVCAEKQMIRNNEIGMAVEEKEERKIAVAVHEEQNKVTVQPNHTITAYQTWGDYNPETRAFTNNAALAIKTLQQICLSTGVKADDVPDFSNNIVASKNFYQVHEGQSNYTDEHLKPVHSLFFQRLPNGRLRCTLLTETEGNELHKFITTQSPGTCWISTTQHDALSGNLPDDIKQNPEYQEIIEQIRYFNGELQLLLEDDATLQWLNNSAKKKLDFYQSHLSSCHETSEGHFTQLRFALLGIQKVLGFIAENHSSIDPDTFKWQEYFADASCDANDIVEYKNATKAFQYVSDHWWNDEKVSNDNNPSYNTLSLQSKAMVDDFTAKRQELKNRVKPLLSSDRAILDIPTLNEILKKLPLNPKEPRIIFLEELIKKSDVNDSILDECIELSKNNNRILLTLIECHSEKFSIDQFEKLASSKMPDSTALSAIISHPHFKEVSSDTVLMVSEQIPNGAAYSELTSIVNHKNCTSPVLAQIAKKSESADILIEIEEKCNNELLVQLELFANPATPEGIIDKLICFDPFILFLQNPSVLTEISQKNNLCKLVRDIVSGREFSIAKEPLVSADVLGKLLLSPHLTPQTMQEIAKRENLGECFNTPDNIKNLVAYVTRDQSNALLTQIIHNPAMGIEQLKRLQNYLVNLNELSEQTTQDIKPKHKESILSAMNSALRDKAIPKDPALTLLLQKLEIIIILQGYITTRVNDDGKYNLAKPKFPFWNRNRDPDLIAQKVEAAKNLQTFVSQADNIALILDGLNCAGQDKRVGDGEFKACVKDCLAIAPKVQPRLA